MFLLRNSYIILNKELIKQIGINASIVLSELINYQEIHKKNTSLFFITKIAKIELETSLPVSKIKQGIKQSLQILR